MKIKRIEKDFYERLKIEPLYLINEFEQCVVRTLPDGDDVRVFIKFKDSYEFEADTAINKIAHDTLYIDRFEISKEDYEQY